MPLSLPTKTSALVVGAGVSGLVVARRLAQVGVEALVVEARDRLGGRVLGVAPSPGLEPLDLGPAWLWPASNERLFTLTEELGLTLFDQHVEGAMVLDLPRGTLRQPTYGQGSKRIVGGMQRLVDRLAEELAPPRLGTVLTQLSCDAKGVKARLEQDGASREVTTQAVFLALPPRLLAEVAFEPSLPSGIARTWAATPTWMAGHAKLVAVYDEPFWRADGLSGMGMSRRGPLVELHDHSDAAGRYGALFGFFGIDAEARDELGVEALKEAAVAQLVRMYGPRARTPVRVELVDWAQERFTARPRDRADIGIHPEAPPTALPAPFDGHLFLAGSEMDPTIPGYLEGAVRAAEAAVSRYVAPAAAPNV